MVVCKECGNEMNEKAAVCVKCGVTTVTNVLSDKYKILGWCGLLLILLVLPILYLFISHYKYIMSVNDFEIQISVFSSILLIVCIIYSINKIIDFLFDLDKKTDK